MPERPSKGQIVELEDMLAEFYILRDWDENGAPRRTRLEQLGLA